MGQLCRNRNTGGFTLIELMIAVAVVAIIVAVAYPSYVEQVRKSRRADATTALMDLAGKLERYYAGNGSYDGTTVTALRGSDTSENGHYTLTIRQLDYSAGPLAAGAQNFGLQAAPNGDQANDRCGTFRINSLGVRSLSGATETLARCW